MCRAPVKALRTAYSAETFGRRDAVSLCTSSLCPIKIGVKIIVGKNKIKIKAVLQLQL